jgi:aldehyde dehydrogenase (NAD+)
VFTGSSRVARIVMQAAAKHLTPLTMELGGKSPCVVMPDADPEITARRITWGRFTNAGQTCVAPDYILTDPQTAQKLIPAIKKAIREMFGDDASRSADYGRMINEHHFDRVFGLIEPDKTVVGGNANRETRFIEPTVMHPVSRDNACMQEEIFGPLLPIMEIDHIEQAINHIRSGPKPLAAYLFTNTQSAIDKFNTQISAGSICINDVMLFMAVEGLPFGGVGESGSGSYNGVYGFNHLSHQKAVLKRSFWPDIRIRYAPSSKGKMKWLRRLR